MVNCFAELRHRHRRHIRVAGVSCVAGVICAVVLFHGSQAQTASADIPNFAPEPYTNWDSAYSPGDAFYPPASGPGPVIQDPEHRYTLNAPGDDTLSDPTYRIADLSNPILTPWSIEKMAYWNDIALSGTQAPIRARARCYPPGGAAHWSIFRNGGPPMHYFVQTPDQVLMLWRGDNQVRRIYLNVPHSENPKHSWIGESVGHYEGNTLVVDTIAMLEHPLSFVDNFRTPHSDKIHVVERYTLVDPDTVDIEVYVEDPIAFTTPWKGVNRWLRNTIGHINEQVCGEIGLTPGDFSFGHFTVPILQAEIPDF